MAFTEALKIRIRQKAHYCCCLCHRLEIEIHHIIPQAEGGLDDDDNAAPLCASCHETYGANPQKRKFIREARDHWYEVCANRFKADPDGLAEIRRALENLATKDEIQGLRREILGPVREGNSTSGTLSSSIAKLAIRGQRPTGKSASGLLNYELRSDPHNLGVEVWIWKNAREDAFKLCDTEGWGNFRIYFSPNDRFILVEDGGSSMGIHLRLFTRIEVKEGPFFTEKESANIEDKAENFLLERAGLPPGPILDHRYAHCWYWSENSCAILFHISGHGVIESQAYRISSLCVYDLESDQVALDLARMNPKPVTRSRSNENSH